MHGDCYINYFIKYMYMEKIVIFASFFAYVLHMLVELFELWCNKQLPSLILVSFDHNGASNYFWRTAKILM